MAEKLPPGITGVHRIYVPDRERMIEALRLVLAATTTEKEVDAG